MGKNYEEKRLNNPLRKLTTATVKQRNENQSKNIQASEKTGIQASEKTWPPPATFGDWREQANCAGKNHKMFPRKHKDISYIPEARKLCAACPVKTPCLQTALTWPATDMHGVWAGKTPRQLAKEQIRQNITPTKPTIAQIWAEYTKQQQQQQQQQQKP